jgi:hypothetical protein
MTIYIKEIRITSSCANGILPQDEATIGLVSSGNYGELFDFIKFFRDKGEISIETLTSYLIHQKLKESK